MCKWFVTGKLSKIEFQHKIEINIDCEFKTITIAITRAEAERKIKIILESKHYHVKSINAELV